MTGRQPLRTHPLVEWAVICLTIVALVVAAVLIALIGGLVLRGGR